MKSDEDGMVNSESNSTENHQGGDSDGVQERGQEGGQEAHEASETAPQEVGESPDLPERPEWLQAKFGDDIEKAVTEQAKAYDHLQKKMGEFWGAPKDGYTVPEDANVSASDPLLKHIQPALKDLGLSDKGFAKLLDGYKEATVKMAEEMQKEVQALIKKEEAANIKAVDSWIGQTFDKQDQDTIRNWIQSVDDFRLLNQLRVRMPSSTNVPNTSENQQVSFETRAEIESEMLENKAKYDKDAGYRNQVKQRLRDAILRDSKS